MLLRTTKDFISTAKYNKEIILEASDLLLLYKPKMIRDRVWDQIHFYYVSSLVLKLKF